MPTKHTKQL